MTRNMLARIACSFTGHDWAALAEDTSRAAALGHLSGLAGVLATCRRCGENWDDLPTKTLLDGHEAP